MRTERTELYIYMHAALCLCGFSFWPHRGQREARKARRAETKTIKNPHTFDGSGLFNYLTVKLSVMIHRVLTE